MFASCCAERTNAFAGNLVHTLACVTPRSLKHNTRAIRAPCQEEHILSIWDQSLLPLHSPIQNVLWTVDNSTGCFKFDKASKSGKPIVGFEYFEYLKFRQRKSPSKSHRSGSIGTAAPTDLGRIKAQAEAADRICRGVDLHCTTEIKNLSRSL